MICFLYGVLWRQCVCVFFFCTAAVITKLLDWLITWSHQCTQSQSHTTTCTKWHAPTNDTHINTPHSRCGVKAPLIKWHLGYMSGRHPRWRGVRAFRCVITTFPLSLCANGCHPPVLDRVRAVQTHGVPCLCVCACKGGAGPGVTV